MLDLAKYRFALLRENLRNGQAGFALDFRVEIDEVPGQLSGEQAADRALARAHESGQADHAVFRGRPCAGMFDGDESCKRFRER